MVAMHANVIASDLISWAPFGYSACLFAPSVGPQPEFAEIKVADSECVALPNPPAHPGG